MVAKHDHEAATRLLALIPPQLRGLQMPDNVNRTLSGPQLPVGAELCWAKMLGEYREVICKKPKGHDDDHGGYEPTEGMGSRWWEWSA